jgi:hypothetical protein
MPQFFDPKKARLFPECAIEAVDQASVSTSGETVSRYSVSPYHVSIENMHVDPTADMDVFLGVDGVAERMKYRSNACIPISGATIEDYWKREKFTASKSLDISYRMTAAAATHAWGRWNLTVRAPSIIEKLRIHQKLTAEEQQISDNLDLEDNLAVGSLPMQPSLLDPRFVYTQNLEIEPIYRSLTALAANSASIIGNPIPCPSDRVMFLLGISIDDTFAANYSDTFITVDRDDRDFDYLKLDASAMPNKLTVPCYIPFTEKLVVNLETTTGSGGNTVECGIVVGSRPRTLMDHLKWGNDLPYRSEVESTEAQQLIDKYTKNSSPRDNLISRIKAGLI